MVRAKAWKGERPARRSRTRVRRALCHLPLIMSETELRVQAYIAAQNDSDLDVLVECKQIDWQILTRPLKPSSASSAGAAALLEVVKALGPYLTSEEDKLRERGLLVLTFASSR